jgi:hypothetical protein
MKASRVAALQAQAQTDQAETVKGLRGDVRRLERKLDEVLALLAPAAPASEPAKPAAAAKPERAA